MVDIKVVRKYNSDCQSAQNMANQSLAKIDLLDKQIEAHCKELTSLLGREVTIQNFEAVYQEVSHEVETLVTNGNDLLRRVQEEKQANEAVAGAGNYNVQGQAQTPVNQQVQAVQNPMNMGAVPNQGIMAGMQGNVNQNAGWNNPNGMPQYNQQQAQFQQQAPMNNQQATMTQQGYGGQQGFANGPFGVAQAGIMPNNSIPTATPQGNFNANSRGQVPLPVGNYNTSDIIGEPVDMQ